MDTRTIGSLEVSRIGYGCNQFGGRLDLDGTRAVLDAALSAGITFFDTADVYSAGLSEEYLGTALGSRRSDVVVATKFGAPMPDGGKGASPEYIRVAVEASLRRLKTDYIDLYQLHMPDEDTPLDDTLDTLNQLIDEGKVREIGASNFTAAQLSEAQAVDVSQNFVSVQNEYSIITRKPELSVLDACRDYGLAFLPYFPLAGGLLTGKYARGESGRLSPGSKSMAAALKSEQNERIVAELSQFAEDRGHTVAELAVAWLLAQEAVTSVIAGATSAGQLLANVEASAWILGDEELAAVDRIAPAHDGATFG